MDAKPTPWFLLRMRAKACLNAIERRCIAWMLGFFPLTGDDGAPSRRAYDSPVIGAPIIGWGQTRGCAGITSAWYEVK